MNALLVIGACAVVLCWLWCRLAPPREDVSHLDDLDDDLTAWAHDWPTTRWED